MRWLVVSKLSRDPIRSHNSEVEIQHSRIACFLEAPFPNPRPLYTFRTVAETNEMTCKTQTEQTNVQRRKPRRRNSIVLTPDVLDQYAKEDEESAIFKKQYEQAHYNVFGSHVSFYYSAISAPWHDQTVYPRYRTDARLVAMGFFGDSSTRRLFAAYV